MKENEKNTTPVVGKIYSALAEIMKQIKAVGKNATNQEQHYSFRSFNDVVDMLHPLLADNNVFILPEVIEHEATTFNTQKGKIGTHMMIKVKYTIIHADGSSVCAYTCGEATDYSDKAMNKCMTAALKYMLNQVFMIPFTDSIDQDSTSPEIPVGAKSIQPIEQEQEQQGQQALSPQQALMSSARKEIQAAADQDQLTMIYNKYTSLQNYGRFTTMLNNKWNSLTTK